MRSNCSAVVFERNDAEEYESAATKSRCEIANVCASMIARSSPDSSSGHVDRGAVDGVVGTVVSTTVTVVDDSATTAVSATSLLPAHPATTKVRAARPKKHR